MITAQAVAERNRRSARELARIPSTCIRWREQISEATHSLNDFDAKFLADTPDEHFHGIRVAIEILIVKVLDQFRARYDAAGMMHQVGEQPVFVAGQLDRVAVDRDASRTGIEPD